MLESLTNKQKIIFYIILSIMLIFIIYYIYSNLYISSSNFYDNNTLVNNDLLINTNNEKVSNSSEIENNLIIVYVCGAVKKNKVVTLKENSRVCDAIDAVGGVTSDADLTNINLAYMLEDGEKIYIPKKGEETQIDSIISSNSSSSIKNKKININKATQTELETIPGVGPSTASKIIDYREKNGKFTKIEDIKNVSGIGDAKYENIKEYITIK